MNIGSVMQNSVQSIQQIKPQVQAQQQCCQAQQPCASCQAQTSQPTISYQPQYGAQPQYVPTPAVNYQTQPQTVQVPNYSGVNIQIFNPSVGAPGAAPVYNVNAPQYQTPSCYPSEYYTNQMGKANGTGANGANSAKTTADTANANSATAANATNNTNSTTDTNTTTTNKTVTEEKKKTEKRDIVELTDSYIKNLENYLNSQDKEIRLMGAKEVVARLQEDDSRKSDKALTALINKMLQDPCQQIRIMALSMLDSRNVIGDDYTVGILKAMQQSDSGYGQDSLSASQILLKMSGQTVQKEFEVKPKKEDK